MMLQKMWAVRGGRSEPVRRNKYAQWKPNNEVYIVWKTVGIWSVLVILMELVDAPVARSARLAAAMVRPYRL